MSESAVTGDHAKLFETQRAEAHDAPMRLEGDAPAWLRGVLLRTGPGVFESPRWRASHWFEGLAFMTRVAFGEGAPRFSARALRSESYHRAHRPPRLPPWARALATRARPLLPNRRRSDNAGVHVLGPYADVAAVAMTETPHRVRLDPRSLHGAPMRYRDALRAHLTTAHPARDDARGAWFNYGTRFGKDATYVVWRVPDGSRRRREVARLSSPRPSYMHSFAATQNHVLLTEFPLFVQPLCLRFGAGTLFDYLRWDPSAPTRIRAVHKDSGALAGEWHTDPEFAFHHVAARETDGGFEVDLVGYDDARVLFDLRLERLRSSAPPDGMGRLRRYTLRRSGRWERRALADVGLELPRVDPRRRHRPLRWVYGVGDSGAGRFNDQLVRLDTEGGEPLTWHDERLLPGEPVFVPRPGGEDERDGVILSLALDPARDRSALVLLDPVTFTERARAWAPIRVPQGFHGDFHPSR